ncbi:MAG: hypothetical protein E5Y85_09335 [Mesorhizobium sp.]|nr:MAG: hypothetical protein E5Y85_09335 [Mesorhizobium sp.]
MKASFHTSGSLGSDEACDPPDRGGSKGGGKPDWVGRNYYEHGTEPGQGYRNGVRGGRQKTAEGFVEYSAPQVAGRDEPFRSEIREHLKGRTEALEDLAVELLARGLSVRDIEDAFRRLLLSKTAVSEIGERLWADYQELATRDLGEYEIAYLFVDGIAEPIRPRQKREPVLAAWAFTASGAKVLLHLMAGSKEEGRNGDRLLQDMRGRRLGDPLLVVCDGAAGIIKAIETCFPRGASALPGAPDAQSPAKVPEDRWPEFKARGTAAYQAPSRATARDLAAGLVKDYEAELPSAVVCFMDDFEAAIAHLRMPITHRRATSTASTRPKSSSIRGARSRRSRSLRWNGSTVQQSPAAGAHRQHPAGRSGGYYATPEVPAMAA